VLFHTQTTCDVRRPNRPVRRQAVPEPNRLAPEDRPVHDWYRFVLSFPPHLVRDYVARFGLGDGATLLDPFCGTGTTIVEGQKLGLHAVGIEAHPFSHFASTTKTQWTARADELMSAANDIAGIYCDIIAADGLVDDDLLIPFEEAAAVSPQWLRLPDEQAELLLANSISPLPLHKTLRLTALIDAHSPPSLRGHLRLALAKAICGPIGNLHFGPEVGVGPAKKDAPVLPSWLANVRQISADLDRIKTLRAGRSVVHHADSRDMASLLKPRSIDAVITSPPYPNEKDYTRTTRLESVLLGFVRDKAHLRALKQGLVRSNTRNVYVNDTDDAWVRSHPEIQRIATAIESRRIELGKTSGFERLYARVTKLYFGGMARHLAELRPALKSGARLAYVVGDQASYLRIMIRTGQILASIAEELGYKVEAIDLFRTRLATATREQLREEVVVLRWPA